jgi:hypothetical protein
MSARSRARFWAASLSSHTSRPLADSRASGYADVSSGRSPTGPDKYAGPALMSQRKPSQPGLLPYQRASRRRMCHPAHIPSASQGA